MISAAELLPHGLEFVGTLLTFFFAYILVKRQKATFIERQKLRVAQRKKLDDDAEQLEPAQALSFPPGLARDPPCKFVPYDFSIKTAAKQEEDPENHPQVMRKEPKSKKSKSTKRTTTPSDAMVPQDEKSASQAVQQETQCSADASELTVQEEKEKTQLEVPKCCAEQENVSTETMDFGFQEVMPSKKATRKEGRLRPKAQETQDEVVPVPAKPKPHCPPPSHRPVRQPLCPPPSHPPAMQNTTKVEDAEQQTAVPPESKGAELQTTIQDEVADTVQPGVVEKPESSQPVPVQSQNQFTPLDKEILNLEKKVREIQKLQEMQAAGTILDKKQEEKIERAGNIGLQLSQLYSSKFVAEQQNVTVTYFGTPRADSFDISTPPTEAEVQKKKRARKAKGASTSSSKTHTPVVVPPPLRNTAASLEKQSANQPHMWVPLAQVGEECEDFGMMPLDPPDLWQNAFGLQNPAHQFNFVDEWCAPDAGQVATSVSENWSSESDALVCEPVSKRKDDCWEWFTTGACPRGSHCRWNHRPIANGAIETSVLALNLDLGSDAESD